MRPIHRGEPPLQDGCPVEFKEYADARGELIKRLGEYCSYCEMHLDSSLAVEHIQPKKPEGSIDINQQRALDWNNFLLACTNCNSTKGDNDVTLQDYLWPDRDNTFRAFSYTEGGLVSVAEELESTLQQKARNTIQLVGLDKTPHDTKASDRRWSNRKEAWDIATRFKTQLMSKSHNRDAMKNIILELAQAKGFWSVWMHIFADDTDMLARLIQAFPGTCEECFAKDRQYKPIRRPSGQC